MRKKEVARLLKEFFNDSPQTQELINQKLKGFTFTSRPDQIKAIVEAYNE